MTALRTILTEHILEIVLLFIGIYIVHKAYRKRKTSPSAHAYYSFSVASLVYLSANVFMIMPRYGICLLDKAAGYVIYSVYLTALAVNAYYWFCYVETSLGSGWVKSGKLRTVMFLPVVAFAVLCGTTHLTGLVFTSGPHAEYGYGSMWFLQYIFCFGYLAAATVRSVANCLHPKNRTAKDWVLVSSMFICLAAAAMQIAFSDNYMSIAITLGLLLTYSELYSTEIRNIEDLKKQMMYESELEEKAKIALSFTKNFNVAYIVNLSDDSFEQLRMDSDMIGHDMQFNNFSQAVDFFLSKAVYHVDRDRMCRELDYGTIRDRLSECNSYSAEYRVIIGGCSVWHEMTVTSLSADLVAIGFAVRNREIILRHLHEKETEDYYTLFSVDLDTELITVVKACSWYNTGKEGESAPFVEVVRKYADSIDGESRAFFLDMCDLDKLKAKLVREDKYSYSYQSFFVDDRKWISATACVIIRHDDGSPAVISLGFSIMDTMSSDRQSLSIRLKQNMEVIGGLAGGYLALYYINFSNSIFKVYSVDEQRIADTKQLLSEDNDPFALFSRFVLSQAVHPDDREQFANLDMKSVKRRLTGSRKFSIHFRRNYGEGYLWSVMDVIRVGSISEEPDAVIVGFGECDREIRNEHERERQLKEALSTAKSASIAKTNFLNNLSHDIRTPMNAIVGFAGLAMKYIGSTERVQDCLNKISKSSDHLLSLINDVLDMSRIESGKMTLEEKNENLLEIMDTLGGIVQSNVNAKRLNFSMDVSRICFPNVVCDRLRLNQVLLNIVSNSIKYTHAGGMVSVSLKERESRQPDSMEYEFTVTDNGMGMSKEFLKTIFDPFSRVKSSSMTGIQGSGLGMAITKNIIDMMGGSIDISSELGKGTTVAVRFNFRLQNDNLPAQEMAGPDIAETQIDLNGHRVLLVEDNELNREIATVILEEFGITVIEADDGEMAVEKIKAAKPGDIELVLMDIQMPGIDGYEATRQIRALNSEISGIPILAMTANAFEEDRQEAFRAGMDEHISKPIDMADLKRKLSRFLSPLNRNSANVNNSRKQ